MLEAIKEDATRTGIVAILLYDPTKTTITGNIKNTLKLKTVVIQ